MKFIFALMVIFNIVFSSDSFEKRGDVVVDNRVGVMWQSKPSTQKFTWSDAKGYCASLNYGGYSDWRVPHIDELVSLTNKSRYNPAVATDLIELKGEYYWSSIKYKDDNSLAWGVTFYEGYVDYVHKTVRGYVLCVRG